MSAALFGKLPAKRDFVSRHVPPGFAGVVEPWLQEALARSRQSLGPAWQAAYLSAPIWRFWLPPGLVGEGTIGALMPSVDGIGRFFPLVIMEAAPAGEGFAHPSYDGHDAWFDAVEGILLGALHEETTLDMVLAWMSRLRPPPPGDKATLVAPEDKDRPAHGTQRPLGPGLHRLRRAPPPPYIATAWWTMGGAAFPAMALAWDGMPETSFYMEMIVPPAAAPPLASSAGPQSDPPAAPAPAPAPIVDAITPPAGAPTPAPAPAEDAAAAAHPANAGGAA